MLPLGPTLKSHLFPCFAPLLNLLFLDPLGSISPYHPSPDRSLSLEKPHILKTNNLIITGLMEMIYKSKEMMTTNLGGVMGELSFSGLLEHMEDCFLWIF